jgi:hypothetical protein
MKKEREGKKIVNLSNHSKLLVAKQTIYLFYFPLNLFLCYLFGYNSNSNSKI